MNIKFESIDTKLLDQYGDTDLLSRYDSLRDSQVSVLELVRIDTLTAMRLDLFCKAYYGSIDDLELFLLVNGIVNPFEEPVGRILIMPEMTSLRKTINKINIRPIEDRNKEIANNPYSMNVSTSGTSSISSKRKVKDMTRNIGFRKMDNGNLIF